jgi:signal transduction histidine kinase
MTLEHGETGAYAHLISLTIVFCSMLLTDSLNAWTWALLGLIIFCNLLRRHWSKKYRGIAADLPDWNSRTYFALVTASSIGWVLLATLLANTAGFTHLTTVTTLLMMSFIAAGSITSLGSAPTLGTTSNVVLLGGVLGIVIYGGTTLESSVLGLSLVAFGGLVSRQFWVQHASLKQSIKNELAAETRAEELRILMEERSRFLENERRAAILDLASGVAHEINNPLTILMGRCYLLKSYVDSTQSQGKSAAIESLGVVQQTIRRISGIVATMNLLTEGVEPDEIPEAAATWLTRSIDTVTSERELSDVKLETDFHALDGHLVKFGSIFHTCVNAVLENALFAASLSPKGQKTVQVGASINDNFLRIVISDSGPGIDRLNPESIFNPFMTTRDPGKGLGLGLSVARNLSERCGGTLRILKPHSPTTFEITTLLANDGLN